MEFVFIVCIIILILVTIFGYKFWIIKKRKSQKSSEEIHFNIIIKDGIFQPSIIKAPEEKILILHFIRQDPSGLAESISFPQLSLNYPLSMNEPIVIIIPSRAFILNEIDFVCRLGVYTGMYTGKIIVKKSG